MMRDKTKPTRAVVASIPTPSIPNPNHGEESYTISSSSATTTQKKENPNDLKEGNDPTTNTITGPSSSSTTSTGSKETPPTDADTRSTSGFHVDGDKVTGLDTDIPTGTTSPILGNPIPKCTATDSGILLSTDSSLPPTTAIATVIPFSTNHTAIEDAPLCTSEIALEDMQGMEEENHLLIMTNMDTIFSTSCSPTANPQNCSSAGSSTSSGTRPSETLSTNSNPNITMDEDATTTPSPIANTFMSDAATSSTTHKALLYYAVRQGLGDVRSCIFLNWEDCRRHVMSKDDLPQEEGKEEDTNRSALIEYQTFSSIDLALQYLRMDPSQDPNKSAVIAKSLATAATVTAKSRTTMTPVRTLVERKNHPTPGKKWMSNFRRLQEYSQKYGSAKVSSSNKQYKDLIAWSKLQRGYYHIFSKGIRTSPMTPMKIQLLQSIGFSFHIDAPQPHHHPVGEKGIEREGGENHEANTSSVDAHDVSLGLTSSAAMDSNAKVDTSANAIPSSTLTLPTATDTAHTAVETPTLTPTTRSKSALILPLSMPKSATITTASTTRNPYRVTKRWNSMFEKLVQYRDTHDGSLHIPNSEAQHADLCRWCSDQQAQYKAMKEGRGHYLEEKIRRLASIGFQFRYHSWEERIQQLMQYKKQYMSVTNSNLSTTATPDEGVDNQETEEESVDEKDDGKKRKRTNSSEQYIPIPTNHPQLGKWWRNFQVRAKNGNVNSQRIEQIQDLGFDPFSRSFFSSHSVAHDNTQSNHSLMKVGTSEDETLQEDTKPEQNEVEGAMIDSNDDGENNEEEENRHWEEMFQKLKEYKEQHGNCDYPTSKRDQLATWVYRQRAHYRKILREDEHTVSTRGGKKSSSSKLTAARMSKLNHIGFKFLFKDTYVSWKDRFEQLKQFIKIHGHCRVPTTYNTIDGLGTWVSGVRQEYRKFSQGSASSLTQERVDALTALGFEFQAGRRRLDKSIQSGDENADEGNIRMIPSVPKMNWDQRFDELLMYKSVHGNTIVPQSYGALGKWVNTQRVQYKKFKAGNPSSITAEKALKLSEIGFIFDLKSAQARTSTEGGIAQQMDEDINDELPILNVAEW